MLLLYTLGIKLYSLIIWLLSPFNQKAKLFFQGRKHIFEKISAVIDPNEKHIWFHFASLGEFEQGRPVLEKLKSIYPNKKIVITFFSPSGYEIRKNYALAEAVFYLPVDSPSNARKFIACINPEMVIFTKYEFWHYYFNALYQKNIPLYLISGIFRENQIFFKSYGGFYKNLLKKVTYFFVQNQESVDLLKSIQITNVQLSGDTRFDRVYENAQQPKKIEQVENFIQNKKVFIAGSTWPEDEKLLVHLAEQYPDWKIIIAPHEIGKAHIQEIESLFPKALKLSTFTKDNSSQILIIDNIGMLSSLYQYAQIAYIGGGFGAGIHNTLEAVAFGLPVIFGPKYQKFQEAKDLITIGIAQSVNNETELLNSFNYFNEHPEINAQAKSYIEKKKGSTDMILNYIRK